MLGKSAKLQTPTRTVFSLCPFVSVLTDIYPCCIYARAVLEIFTYHSTEVTRLYYYLFGFTKVQFTFT